MTTEQINDIRYALNVADIDDNKAWDALNALLAELDAARAREQTLDGRLAATEMRLAAAEQSHDAAGRKVIEMSQTLRKLRAREAKLREALVLAQKWLANCVPVVHLDGPKPLPVIAAALAEGEDTRG